MTEEFSHVKSLPRWLGQQRRIGITGGIASGKSTIGKYIEQKKELPILDADLYAHEALAPGQSSTEEVIRRYGDEVIDKTQFNNCTINRKALRRIIFKNKEEKLWLEKLLHPKILNRIDHELKITSLEPIVIIILPLLYELNLTSICSEIWVVSCTPDQQISRVMDRDKVSMKEAREIIDTQIPLTVKMDLADIVINNENGQNAWKEQVDKLL